MRGRSSRKGKSMELKTWLEQAVTPLVRADGGWLEMKEETNDTAFFLARGECSHCQALDRCLRWVENRAQKELGREIRMTAVRDPFLWRK